MKSKFQQKFVISVVSITKPKNIVVFAFTFVFESFALYGDFCMDLYSDESDEALKASWLQFLSSVKRFVVSSRQFLSQR
jgi:hypothetical protein